MSACKCQESRRDHEKECSRVMSETARWLLSHYRLTDMLEHGCHLEFRLGDSLVLEFHEGCRDYDHEWHVHVAPGSPSPLPV